MKYILLRQCTHVFNPYCRHCITNISWCNSINRNWKKLNKMHYKNQEIWLEPGLLFFSSTEPHIALILFLYFEVYIELQYLSKFCLSVLEITPHLVDKLSVDIFMVITVYLCFPNLDRNWFKPWLFLFCYFPVNLKECIVFCLISFNNICMFFFCSILWAVFTRLFRINIAYIESKN